MTTLSKAREFVKRNRIRSEADYHGLGMNPWAEYERYKRHLAEEINPSSPGWGEVCRELAAALRI